IVKRPSPNRYAQTPRAVLFDASCAIGLLLTHPPSRDARGADGGRMALPCAAWCRPMPTEQAARERGVPVNVRAIRLNGTWGGQDPSRSRRGSPKGSGLSDMPVLAYTEGVAWRRASRERSQSRGRF